MLDSAIVLSGQASAHLPVVLTSVLPNVVSSGAEAWTLYDEHGHGQRIFMYTRGRIFHCASIQDDAQYQCMLRLASIVVHEAWHLKNGPDEAAAYDAQLGFLESNGASPFQILDIHRSRRLALAQRRNAGKKAGVKVSESAAADSPG